VPTGPIHIALIDPYSDCKGRRINPVREHEGHAPGAAGRSGECSQNAGGVSPSERGVPDPDKLDGEMLAGCARSHITGSTLRWVALACALASCTAHKAGKHEVATGGPAQAAPNSAPSAAIYARTDRWPLREASRAPTAVEVQLSRHFQQVLAGAQFSTQYSCVARETAAFVAQYSKLPDELLSHWVAGACEAPDTHAWVYATLVHSNLAVLDAPFSDSLLAETVRQLTRTLPPMTVFGIATHYMTGGAIVLLVVSAPPATAHITSVGATGLARVEGKFAKPRIGGRALINQGAFGGASCEAVATTAADHFAFDCPMAVGDDETWLSVVATDPETGYEGVMATLLARRPGLATAEYRRPIVTLPANEDTAHALLDKLNELRVAGGSAPLVYAEDQSALMQATEAERFHSNMTTTTRDPAAQNRLEHLKGRAVDGAIRWAKACSSVSLDGGPAEWLATHLAEPNSRATLMDPAASVLAISTHGDPKFGFGATAIVYTLFDERQERLIDESVAAQLAEARGTQVTKRLTNPRSLQNAAQLVAAGVSPQAAFGAAIRAENRDASSKRYIDGTFVTVPWMLDGLVFPSDLLIPERLEYGIVVTHAQLADDAWARPVVLIWFVATRPSGSLALR